MKVIQCWDDGVVDDIRLVEIIRRYDVRATFCLNPGLYREERSFGWVHDNREVWRLRTGELTDVYDGFEICSHSLTHPCLTEVPAEQLDREVRVSRDILQDVFKKPVLGFCYPFNAYNDVVKAAVQSTGYLWARSGGYTDDVFQPRDPFEFNFSCHFLSSDFWPRFNKAKEENGVFSFWGHSCEIASETMWHDFEGMIEKISEDANAEWSFINDLFIGDSS